jgi:hypothetical protein
VLVQGARRLFSPILLSRLYPPVQCIVVKDL